MSEWNPMDTAPRDGTSFLIPPQHGYTHCFWQEPFFWWHTVEDGKESDYAVGPDPEGWMPAPPTAPEGAPHAENT